MTRGTAVAVFVLAFAVGGMRLSAQPICSPDALALPGADPAVIRGSWQIAPGCTLDFGGRAVVLQGELSGSDMTLLAGAFSLLDTGSISCGDGTVQIVLRTNATHDGSATLAGAVVGKGESAGSMLVDADGAVTVAATASFVLTAAGAAGSGGHLLLQSRRGVTLLAGAAIDALAGPAGFGGEVDLISLGGSISQGALINIRGGENAPAAVIVRALQDIELRGDLNAFGGCTATNCWAGGRVEMTAGGSIALSRGINVRGADGTGAGGEGAGGEALLDAAGDIQISTTLDLSSGHASRGGSFLARTDANFLQKSGSILANGRFDDSSGGRIQIAAGGTVTLLGLLNAGGGADGESGNVEVSAVTDLAASGTILNAANFPLGKVELVSQEGAVTAKGKIDAGGTGPFGTGGEIGVYAATGIALDAASLDASGEGADGLGGVVRLDSLQGVSLGAQSKIAMSGDPLEPKAGQGGIFDLTCCYLDSETNTQILAQGLEGGTIAFVASFGVRFPSLVNAGESGIVACRYPLGQKPDTTGAVVVPEPILEPGGVLDPCFETPVCDSVSDLVCAHGETGVTLSWVRALGQSGARIQRDGVLIATTGPGEDAYLDANPPPGLRTYVAQSMCGSIDGATTGCRVTVPEPPEPPAFSRGDCNGSKRVDISDPVLLVFFLFEGTPKALPCSDACDGNDDGKLDITDVIRGLEALFDPRGQPLPPPYGKCGADPSEDALGCAKFEACP